MNVNTCERRSVLNPCTLKGLNYQVDPYIGCAHYCYYCYALSGAETDWSKEILMHEDIGSQLGRELGGKPPQAIYMGYHSDPYQPCEADYFQTREVLELFERKDFSASILTKSDLVTRDIDLLQRMDSANVSVSVAFNDNRMRRLFEADTMDTEKRIDALRQMKEAGVKTGALLCPVIPYITDAIQLIDLLEPYADVIWIYGLSMNDPAGETWLHVKGILEKNFPHVAEQSIAAILSKDHGYWARLRKDLAALKKDRQLALNIHL